MSYGVTKSPFLTGGTGATTGTGEPAFHDNNEPERDALGNIIHRDALGAIIQVDGLGNRIDTHADAKQTDAKQQTENYASERRNAQLEGGAQEQQSGNPVTGKTKDDPTLQATAEHPKIDITGQPLDPIAQHNLENKEQILRMANSLPQDDVGRKVIADFVNPVMNGSTNDQATNRVVATMANFEDVSTGRPQTAGSFNLAGLENLQAVRGMISDIQHLPRDYVASEIQEAAVYGQAGQNMLQHMENRAAEQLAAGAHLPRLGGTNT